MFIITLPTSPKKFTSSSTINISQTLPSSINIADFCIDNDLKKEHISAANKVKRFSLTTENNEIKDNKTEKQTTYANNNSSHITATKKKNSNSNINSNNTNGNSNNDNIQDTITPNPSPNPSENEPPDQSIGDWKKGTTLIVGDSMITGLRLAKLSKNR